MSKIDELIKGAPEFWFMSPDQLVPHAYAMFALISKLYSENTELREQGARLFDKTLELGTENAKLRKLVRMMWLACKSKGIVGGIYEYPNRNSNTEERVRFEPLLQELGIKVEE